MIQPLHLMLTKSALNFLEFLKSHPVLWNIFSLSWYLALLDVHFEAQCRSHQILCCETCRTAVNGFNQGCGKRDSLPHLWASKGLMFVPRLQLVQLNLIVWKLPRACILILSNPIPLKYSNNDLEAHSTPGKGCHQ